MRAFLNVLAIIFSVHSTYNVCSAYTYRPRVSPKARISQIFCVVSTLQPLQKRKTAIFDSSV